MKFKLPKLKLPRILASGSVSTPAVKAKGKGSA